MQPTRELHELAHRSNNKEENKSKTQDSRQTPPSIRTEYNYKDLGIVNEKWIIIERSRRGLENRVCFPALVVMTKCLIDKKACHV